MLPRNLNVEAPEIFLQSRVTDLTEMLIHETFSVQRTKTGDLVARTSRLVIK